MRNYKEERQKILESAGHTVKELLERKSVRVFTEREISNEEKRQILFAAAEAPTAGCQQLYTILDITDPEKKKALSESCDHQPFIEKAPLVLVFCTDCRRWWKAYEEAGCEPRKPGVGDFLLSLADTAIAAQNSVTAAWSLGIGSCYIGDILENAERQKEILELPDYVVPTVMVVFGFPTKQQKEREKPARFAMEDVVFENAYPKPKEIDLRSAFAARCGEQSFEDWIEKFCRRKYESDFAREMNRSAETILKKFSE